MLNRKFDRILYIDIDMHHGDGVQNAFYESSNVFTLSFHRRGSIITKNNYFYPGTGSVEEIGEKEGKYYCVNVPLPQGVGDTVYKKLFTDITTAIFEKYQPEVVVLQAGADCIKGDPAGGDEGLMLSIKQFGQLIKHVRNYCLQRETKLLVFGGGGYNVVNVARAWGYATAVLLGFDDLIQKDSYLPACDNFHMYHVCDYKFLDGEMPSNVKGPKKIALGDHAKAIKNKILVNISKMPKLQEKDNETENQDTQEDPN